MKSMKSLFAVAAVALSVTGCSSLDKLHTAAVAERSSNPEKYTEIVEVQLAQMTPNQNGSSYPQSCAFGCPAAEKRIDVTRSW
ncbi:hypothetical protein [Serratia proteamaculans]|uniref:hypothetical protein n=1 Tax=Serratia proteamaculans TaxID=28151 RepID=UPI003D04B705